MRLFIGVAPDEAARFALQESASILRGLVPGRYADASLYHLTLAFLGEQGRAAMPSIQQAMRVAAADSAPFSLTLGRLGAFDTILWRGAEKRDELSGLAASLRQHLRATGVDFDTKPFCPHITLARKTRILPHQLDTPLPGASFVVDRLILFESTRVQDRLAYLPRLEVAL